MEAMTDTLQGLYETVELPDGSSELYIDFRNQRVKLARYEGNPESIAKNTILICKKYDMGKIITMVNEKDFPAFRENGFVHEGTIEGYFRGETGYCASLFSDPARAVSNHLEKEDAIVLKAKEHESQFVYSSKSNFVIRTAGIADADGLAALFDTVFKTYPTPMDNPEYIRSIIKNNKAIFKIAESENKIVSAASADLQPEFLNAEITDCATLEEFRGQGLLSELVHHLEVLLREKSYVTLFSLSRALSAGMNIVLSKHGYVFSGRLLNNCDIMGKFEDMNIWAKRLR